MKKLIIIILTVILLTTVSCDFSKPIFTEDTFPKIDGSTALYPLSVEFAKQTIGLNDDEANELITHNRTHQSYLNLINKEADIILASEPSDEELELAAKNGIELELIPFAKDAFVFIVNKKNKIDSLTFNEIQEIYKGKITNWNKVGGNDEKILPYQRPKNSGSQTVMENKVMKGLMLMKAPSDGVIGMMGETIEKISDYDNADNSIGYSFRYYATTMYPKSGIKLIGINGIKPTVENIKNDTYPLSGTGFIVIRKSEPENSNARKLVNWILSEKGQKSVQKVGYIPLIDSDK